METRSGLHPAVFRVAAIVGVAELGFATILPLLPLYLKEQLRASATLVGIVVATFAAVETVFKTTWGSLTDHVGRKPVMVGGLLLASTAPLIMTALRSPVWFVPLRLVDGMGSAAMWPAAAATMIDRTDGNRRATAMGALNMCFLSGLALGPSLGLFVAAVFHKYIIGFYVASGLLFTAATLAALTFHEPSTARPPSPLGPRRTLGGWARSLVPGVRRSPTLLVMLLVGFIQTAGIGLLTPILVIYAHEVVGASDQVIGIVFLVIVLAVAAVSVPGGRLADHVGRQRVVIWGMVMAAIGMWLLPFAQRGHFVILTAAAVLLGGSYAISSPAWLALMSDAAPAGGTGMAMGASETAQGAGLIVGPLLGGLFYDHLGPRSPFVASAILLTAGTILALLVLRPRWDQRSVRVETASALAERSQTK